jgi:carbon storage regulator CsrA
MMLVIGREVNQSVILGNNLVRVMVTRFSSQGVHLGFDAPERLRVLRSELIERAAGERLPFEPYDVDVWAIRLANRLHLNSDRRELLREVIMQELCELMHAPEVAR